MLIAASTSPPCSTIFRNLADVFDRIKDLFLVAEQTGESLLAWTFERKAVCFKAWKRLHGIGVWSCLGSFCRVMIIF